MKILSQKWASPSNTSSTEKHKDVADKTLFWEMLKMDIRIFAIRFAKKKANAERSTELNLLQKL